MKGFVVASLCICLVVLIVQAEALGLPGSSANVEMLNDMARTSEKKIEEAMPWIVGIWSQLVMFWPRIIAALLRAHDRWHQGEDIGVIFSDLATELQSIFSSTFNGTP